MTKRTEKYIETIEGLEDRCTAEEAEALEEAKDALAFAQTLWDLFADQQLHKDADYPDFSKMENIIDFINAELGAAVIFILSTHPAPEKALKITATKLDELIKQGNSTTPPIMVHGNKKLAERVANTRVIFNARGLLTKTDRITPVSTVKVKNT